MTASEIFRVLYGWITRHMKKIIARRNYIIVKECLESAAWTETEMKEKLKFIQDVQKLMLCAADDSGSDMDELFDDLRILQDTLGEEIRELEEVDPRINDPLPPVNRMYRTIDSFDDTDIRQYFRLSANY